MDVCVLGAGPSGLSAAGALTAAGKSVAVFERSERVGGRCRTLVHNGRTYDMGAILVNDGAAKYERVLKLISQCFPDAKLRPAPFTPKVRCRAAARCVR